MCTRIKTLEEISEQHDRISDYLISRGRYKAACMVDEIFEAIFDRVLGLMGIDEMDDEVIEMAYNEPILVSEYQRLP